MLPVELSAAVLLLNVFFDSTKLRLEESVVISMEVEVSGGVRLLVGGVWFSAKCLIASASLPSLH